ncbi:MAG: DNA gyrase inhibitor YacG [Hyphomicrobium sp.]|uniref:DNA gyrase inhibitor YacG n=1 Tax=Hyphomicrobium sp. TaxID=82 RepID=UPI0039E68F19
MSSSSSGGKPLRCPICSKDAVEAYRPFCSKRCADIDLARWFTGGYAIGGRHEDEGDNAAPAEERKRADEDGEGE